MANVTLARISQSAPLDSCPRIKIQSRPFLTPPEPRPQIEFTAATVTAARCARKRWRKIIDLSAWVQSFPPITATVRGEAICLPPQWDFHLAGRRRRVARTDLPNAGGRWQSLPCRGRCRWRSSPWPTQHPVENINRVTDSLNGQGALISWNVDLLSGICWL